LTRHGFQASALHGDMTQDRRTATLERFRLGEIPILVASDVAARGLDIDDITHVFNYDVPYNAEDYVHRIGRTGRAGRSGRAFTLATPDDGRNVAAIERLIRRAIRRWAARPDEARVDVPKRAASDARDRRPPKPQEKPHAARQDRPPRGREAEPSRAPPAPQRKPAKPQPEAAREGAARGFGDYVPAFLKRGGR
jgi:superfamily II DNA/RNA helicase